MEAIWRVASDPQASYPVPSEGIEADVVIIGAGITGLTTALQLSGAGKRIVVLEALTVGEGCTGGSTGNLYSTVAKGLASVRRKWNDQTLRDVVAARAQAVDHIEATVQRFAIDCQFQRTPLYRIATTADDKPLHSLDEERDAMACAGLSVTHAEQSALPMNIERGLKLDNQAQFNPLGYAQGVARAVSQLGVDIYERCAVREVDDKQGIVRTDTFEVKASHIVHATHTPKGINMLQTEMIPSREYAVSAKLDDRASPANSYPEGIFWVLDPFHSLRSYRHDGQDYLMVIGEKHKVGEGDGENYRRLRGYLSEHFAIREFEHQWSAQQYSSADLLPYIGRPYGKDNVYLATGFAADGLIWGTLAGQLLGDMILERDNPWHKHFDARRFTPAKSAMEWAKENASVAKHFVQDYLTTSKLKELDQVPPGQAKVATLDGEKLAIHRSESGELSVLSAVCPHMKCLVHWNGEDGSWDCPCHGSRFDTRGEVIEGPAYHPLARRGRLS